MRVSRAVVEKATSCCATTTTTTTTRARAECKGTAADQISMLDSLSDLDRSPPEVAVWSVVGIAHSPISNEAWKEEGTLIGRLFVFTGAKAFRTSFSQPIRWSELSRLACGLHVSCSSCRYIRVGISAEWAHDAV